MTGLFGEDDPAKASRIEARIAARNAALAARTHVLVLAIPCPACGGTWEITRIDGHDQDGTRREHLDQFVWTHTAPITRDDPHGRMHAYAQDVWQVEAPAYHRQVAVEDTLVGLLWRTYQGAVHPR